MDRLLRTAFYVRKQILYEDDWIGGQAIQLILKFFVAGFVKNVIMISFRLRQHFGRNTSSRQEPGIACFPTVTQEKWLY